VSKKPLPRRTVPFKLEKHPTAERLANLRAQGIETLDDLDRLASDIASTTDQTTDSTTTQATDLVIDQATETAEDLATTIHIPVAIVQPTANNILNEAPDENNISSDSVENIIDPSTVATDNSKSSTIDANINVAIANTIDQHTTSHIVSHTATIDQETLLEQEYSLAISLLDVMSKAPETLPSTNNTAKHLDGQLASTTASATTSHTSTTIDIITPSTTVNHTEADFTVEELQKTHSLSAQEIYRLMREIAQTKEKEIIRIGTKQLLEKTQIKSHVTIRKAIDELITKFSIQIVEANQGKIPPVYRIVPINEVFSKRNQAAMTIDEDTKFTFQAGKRIWPNSTNEPITHTIASPTTSLTTNHIARHIDSTTTIPTDNKLLAQIKEICKELKIKIVNHQELYDLAKYPISHIIIGICKSLENSSYQTKTLTDCIPEISKHYQSMKVLPESILAPVAYEHFLKSKEKL
jgi:hypothetical protein